MGNKVTIQDIADALGISRNTVSKAINNTDGLADATRERILSKAVEMGYKQFSYVKAMAESTMSIITPHPSGFQGEIALLTGNVLGHSHFASLMLDKFQKEMSELGYTMTAHRVTEADLAAKTLPITFHPGQVRGILCVEMFDWDYDNMLCSLDIPILFVDGPAKIRGRSLPADQLYMDNFTPIVRLVHHLLDRGLTRIGFIGEYDHCQSFYERYMAYCTTMTAGGHPIDPRYVVRYKTVAQLQEVIEALDALPDVFVCANDFVAWDTMQALAGIGKRAPEDVLLSGFDDSAESRFSKPTMTTVHIHTQITAYSAVHLLVTRINAPNLDFRTVHTETELIFRDSTKDKQG